MSEFPQPLFVRIPAVVKAALVIHTRRHVPVPDNSDPVLHHLAPPDDLLADRQPQILRPTAMTKERLGGPIEEGIKETKEHQSRIEV